MVICLNGTSSSGKTSLAKELQEILMENYLYFSIDNILYSLPSSTLNRMTAGQKNPSLDYWRLEESYYLAVQALASRFSLIIDNSIVNDHSAHRLIKALVGHRVLMVGVQCNPNILEERERQRGDRKPGEARSQLNSIHQHCMYDLMLDSSVKSASVLAKSVVEFITSNTPISAFDKMVMKYATLGSEMLLESAIESNLQMTYESRIEAHENAFQLAVDLTNAGEKLRAES